MWILICLIFSNAAIFFFLGEMRGKQRKMEQLEGLTLLSSLWATSAAQGLKQSTVIQRVIERYHPAARMGEQQLAEFEEKFNELVGEPEEVRKPKRDNWDDSVDFDEEVRKDMSELV